VLLHSNPRSSFRLAFSAGSDGPNKSLTQDTTACLRLPASSPCAMSDPLHNCQRYCQFIKILMKLWICQLTFQKRLSRSSGSVWVSISHFNAGICLQSSSYARNKRLSLVLWPQSKNISHIRHLLIRELFHLPSFLKIGSAIPLCNEISRRMEHINHTAKAMAHRYLRCGQSSKSTVSISSPIRDTHSLTFSTLIVLLQLELPGPHTYASIQ
jgi:hypothetical protein